jgi:hypothetical protein
MPSCSDCGSQRAPRATLWTQCALTRRMSASAAPPTTRTRVVVAGRGDESLQVGQPAEALVQSGSGTWAPSTQPTRCSPWPCEPNRGLSTSERPAALSRVTSCCAAAADSVAQVGGVGHAGGVQQQAGHRLSTLRSMARASL